MKKDSRSAKDINIYSKIYTFLQSKILPDIGSRLQHKQVVRSLLTKGKTGIGSDNNNLKSGMIIRNYVQTLSAAETC